MTKREQCSQQKRYCNLNKLICALLLAVALGSFLNPIKVVADNGNTIVHVTATGKCYHRAGCYHLRSDYEITLYEAVVENGYNPCEDCKPPIYDGPAPLHEKMEKSPSGSSSKKSKSVSTAKPPTVTKAEEKGVAGYVILAILAVTLGGDLLFFIIGAIGSFKETRLKRKQEKEYFEFEKKKYTEMYAYKEPLDCVEVPKGVFLRDGLPCTNNTSKGIYGDYTVYVAQNRARVLHIKATCGGTRLFPKNYYYVRKLPHCKKCASGHKVNLPKIDWYEEYRRIDDIKKKYDIP